MLQLRSHLLSLSLLSVTLGLLISLHHYSSSFIPSCDLTAFSKACRNTDRKTSKFLFEKLPDFLRLAKSLVFSSGCSTFCSLFRLLWYFTMALSRNAFLDHGFIISNICYSLSLLFRESAPLPGGWNELFQMAVVSPSGTQVNKASLDRLNEWSLFIESSSASKWFSLSSSRCRRSVFSCF